MTNSYNDQHQTQETGPFLMWNLKPDEFDSEVYGNGDGYDEASQMIIEGKYFMGSPKKNTRSNKFTVLGSDKTHQDDTKEK